MKTTKTIAKMTDTVLLCEERRAWRDAGCAIRHEVGVGSSVGEYIVALGREMSRRGLLPLSL